MRKLLMLDVLVLVLGATLGSIRPNESSIINSDSTRKTFETIAGDTRVCGANFSCEQRVAQGTNLR